MRKRSSGFLIRFAVEKFLPSTERRIQLFPETSDDDEEIHTDNYIYEEESNLPESSEVEIQLQQISFVKEKEPEWM